jgi:hypothetical protein
MVRKVRRFVAAAALGSAAWLCPCRSVAQDVPAIVAPAPAHSAPPALPQGADVGGPACGPLTGLPACAPYQDCNGPLLRGDPLLDRPENPQPGCFAGLDVGAFGPKFKNHLNGTVVNGDFSDQVQVPTAELNWTGAPHVEVGYRLAEGLGEFLVGYESVVSDGRGTLPGFDPDGGAGALKSRLNVNVLDLDYGTREFSLGPRWDMKWRVGLRLASVYFDSRAAGVILERRVTNDFRGAGPRIALDVWRRLPVPELAWFGHFDAAAVMGDTTQNFEETVTTGDTAVGAASHVSSDEAVPVVTAQVGLGWTPCWNGRRVRFAVGYEIQGWWYLGQTDTSSAEMTVQGVFVRGEWNF